MDLLLVIMLLALFVLLLISGLSYINLYFKHDKCCEDEYAWLQCHPDSSSADFSKKCGKSVGNCCPTQGYTETDCKDMDGDSITSRYHCNLLHTCKWAEGDCSDPKCPKCDECDISNESREECLEGWGVNQSLCLAKPGCCYEPQDKSDTQTPWCYKKKSA